MRFEQRKSIVNLFIIFHLSYCTLVWMFHSRRLNNRIDHIHERALRTIYQGYTVIPLLTNYLRWISTCLILEKKFVEKSFQFPLLIHNQLNSLSAEDKMNDIEDTILLLWLFRKRRKSRLMEKKRLKNSGSDLFLTRENWKENFIHFFRTSNYLTQSISWSSFEFRLLSSKNFWVGLHQKLKSQVSDVSRLILSNVFALHFVTLWLEMHM